MSVNLSKYRCNTSVHYYYYYFALAQHEKKDLVFLSAGYTSSQANVHPVALDLECLSQNPCCP